MTAYNLKINGVPRTIDTNADKPLLWVLREDFKLNGSKYGCGIGMCGACTVEVDGDIVRSCVTSIEDAADSEVMTIEGLQVGEQIHIIQEAWIEQQVPQCGYCQSGMIMAALNLLKNNPAPSDSDIKNGITNICRCGTYPRILKAIRSASVKMNTAKSDS